MDFSATRTPVLPPATRNGVISLLHFCTRLRRIRTFARSLCLSPALVPSGPPVLELCPQPIIRFPHGATFVSAGSVVYVPTCQHAPSRLRRAHLCTASLVNRASGPPGLSHALEPSGPRVLVATPCPRVPVSPCQHVPSRRLAPRYATMPLMTFAGSTPVSLKSSPW
jgi:hypothetical protein